MQAAPCRAASPVLRAAPSPLSTPEHPPQLPSLGACHPSAHLLGGGCGAVLWVEAGVDDAIHVQVQAVVLHAVGVGLAGVHRHLHAVDDLAAGSARQGGGSGDGAAGEQHGVVVAAAASSECRAEPRAAAGGRCLSAALQLQRRSWPPSTHLHLILHHVLHNLGVPAKRGWAALELSAMRSSRVPNAAPPIGSIAQPA